MRSLILGLLFISTNTLASDSWLCKEEASQIRGDSVYSCGVAAGATEDAARTQAFDSAQNEFTKVCNSSDNCINRAVTTQPMRTTCDLIGTTYKCYRLVVFHLGDKTSDKTLSGQIKVGMPIKDVVRILGKPLAVEPEDSYGVTAITYRGEMCGNNDVCVLSAERGKLTRTYQFSPKYVKFDF